jgi:hypothetical protein
METQRQNSSRCSHANAVWFGTKSATNRSAIRAMLSTACSRTPCAPDIDFPSLIGLQQSSLLVQRRTLHDTRNVSA